MTDHSAAARAWAPMGAGGKIPAPVAGDRRASFLIDIAICVTGNPLGTGPDPSGTARDRRGTADDPPRKTPPMRRGLVRVGH